LEKGSDHDESKPLMNESKASIEAFIESKIEGKSFRKHKILIVEDDNQLREFIQKELHKDYDLVIAKDGEEGLRKAFFESPDLILSDVVMPNLSGFDLCKTIKNDERTSHLPVILLSAKHSHEKQLEGYDVGADEYIFKPFSIEILKIKIHNLLKQRHDIIEKFKQNSSLFFDDERVENKERELIQSVINVILENISNENINADFIAQKLHISRSLIYIKIESIAGQTVNEFIRNIRLKKAVRLLLQNNLTITEIAYEVGFSSQSYFTRSFTKFFGMSPKEYLLQHKRN
jgi:YesN/AraC family two-component response regulator